MSELGVQIENMLYELQNHALEMNEYKKEQDSVHIEDYINILNVAIAMTRNYQEERESNISFSKSIGETLGIPYCK